jgi:hypothetical protein
MQNATTYVVKIDGKDVTVSFVPMAVNPFNIDEVGNASITSDGVTIDAPYKRVNAVINPFESKNTPFPGVK